MKPNFNQIAALSLSIGCLILLGLTFFFKGNGNNQVMILGAITSAFSASVIYLVKASSDQTHADTTKQLIDGLSNSSPTQQIKNS